MNHILNHDVSSPGWKILLLALYLLTHLAACEQATPWEYLQQKESLAKNMHIHLLKTLSAQKNALISANTEKAKHFVSSAETASTSLEKELAAFAAIPEKTTEQSKTFQEFSTCWAQLNILNRQLLKLAVQNTNTRAQELSIKQSTQALTAFESSLKMVSDHGNRETKSQGDRALIAALKIQSLHMPHILSAENAEMDVLDQKIARLDQEVHAQLAALAGQIPSQALQTIEQKYQTFISLSREIFKLSRQNTNINSVKLELGKKDLVASACEKNLNDLESAIQAQEFKATR